MSANEILGDEEIRYDDFHSDSEWIGVAATSENPIREKSYHFALTTINLYKNLQERRAFVISKQLLRSGTSIGANVEEAIAAESRKDFMHKMALASKEARETVYWLRLLRDSNLASDLDVCSELERALELVRMLTSIVKTTSATSGPKP